MDARSMTMHAMNGERHPVPFWFDQYDDYAAACKTYDMVWTLDPEKFDVRNNIDTRRVVTALILMHHAVTLRQDWDKPYGGGYLMDWSEAREFLPSWQEATGGYG